MSAEPSLWSLNFHAARAPADAALTTELAHRVAALVLPEAWTDDALLEALVASTEAAVYWQEPDETDMLLHSVELRAALEPVASQVGSSASTQWWSSPLAVESQRFVQWTGQDHGVPPPALTGAADRLERWKTAAVEEELRSAHRPNAVTANWTGTWWSTPAMAGLVTTSRNVSGLGALKLLLVEDGLGWTAAAVWPLRPADGIRVYEVTGPSAWTDLVQRYPMDVTLSRRHDWWRSGDHDGNWLIPDWAAVASDFDAVDLTVFGYLATAGRALPVGGGRSMLAGWNADETYWLGDCLLEAGNPVPWIRDYSPSGDGAWRSITD